MFEKHPWSQGFAWISGTRCGHLGDDRRGEFEERGFFVLDKLFDADEVAGITEETDRLQAVVRRLLSRLPGQRLHSSEEGATTFAQHLVSRSSRLRELASDPRLLGIVRDILGPSVNLHWDQAIYKMPDKPQIFPWHQDNGYSFVVPQQFLSIWISLTDITEGEGCLWVAPGLHKLGTLRHESFSPSWIRCFDSYERAEPVPVRAGSVVVFSSLTPHMSDENRSGRTRKAYLVEYAPHGAKLLVGDPEKGMPIGEKPLGNEKWRFSVLRDGKPLGRSLTV